MHSNYKCIVPPLVRGSKCVRPIWDGIQTFVNGKFKWKVHMLVDRKRLQERKTICRPMFLSWIVVSLYVGGLYA